MFGSCPRYGEAILQYRPLVTDETSDGDTGIRDAHETDDDGIRIPGAIAMIKLKRIFSWDRSQTLFECRRCGKNVDADTERCPECDSNDITRYEL